MVKIAAENEVEYCAVLEWRIKIRPSVEFARRLVWREGGVIVSQSAIRQATEALEQQLREGQTHKELANIHASLERIADILEQINSAMQKIVEGP